MNFKWVYCLCVRCSLVCVWFVDYCVILFLYFMFVSAHYRIKIFGNKKYDIHHQIVIKQCAVLYCFVYSFNWTIISSFTSLVSITMKSYDDNSVNCLTPEPWLLPSCDKRFTPGFDECFRSANSSAAPVSWNYLELMAALLSLCLLDIDPATCRRRADGTASSFCIPLSASRTKAAATQQQKPSWLTSRWLLMTTWNIGCLVPHVSGQNSSNTRCCVSLCRLVGSTLVSGGFQETRSQLYFLLHLPNMRDFKANYEAYD